MISRPRAVLDTNVLFPFTLRDTLLRTADEGLFLPFWSVEILNELLRNLIKSPLLMEESKAKRLVEIMRNQFPEAMVNAQGSIVRRMLNNPKDRHVAAIAVTTRSQFIITRNLKDFQKLPKDIKAVSPDWFLCELYSKDPKVITEALRGQADALKNPPISYEMLLNTLSKSIPDFVASVRLSGL
jgi:predicted nucleic acid-binding protein